MTENFSIVCSQNLTISLLYALLIPYPLKEMITEMVVVFDEEEKRRKVDVMNGESNNKYFTSLANLLFNI